ncbi:chemotaxis protein CheW [Massilia solisilvae]|uniref:Chemotaxis protein CheW n=1 Tax=Massilia solisilvae TaxID=1811225 RepID=A0ABT2BQR6_9BURK|nr:chemotaxis protein CheW [Massilia solisilvae]MCS0610857.1 chemotaxis protein CheW [Massilia solisilvae]
MSTTTTRGGPGQAIYASFTVDGDEYAVDVRHVREVVNLPSEITPMPLAPDFVAGVFNLRGTIVPALDARRLLQASPRSGAAATKVVVVELNGVRLGLIVDDTGRVLRPRGDEQTLFEYEDASTRRLVAGVLKIAGALVRVLALPRLIALEDVPHPQDGMGAANGARARAQRKRCIIFRVGAMRLAFAIGGISEIVLASGIERSPVQEDLCAGVMHIREQIVPVVRFSALLQADTQTDANAAESRVIVLDLGTAQVGLLVDAVESIDAYFEDELMRVPVLGRHKAAMFAGCIDFGERGHVFLLDSQNVLDHGEIQRVTGNFSQLFGASEQSARTARRRVEHRLPYLWFRARDAFALPMQQVREIIDHADRLIVMPGAPDFVAGMFNLRGQLVTVVDVRSFYQLGAEESNQQPDRKIVVLDNGDALLGLLVDAVESIVRVDSSDKIPVPALLRHAMAAAVRDDITEVIRYAVDERQLHLQVLSSTRVFAAIAERQVETADA